MSVEHQPRSNESLSHSAEVERAARERLEQLSHQPERADDHPDKRAERAREIINQSEQAPEPQAKAAEQAQGPSLHAHLSHIFNYAETMASMQRRLSPTSRRFSRVIHTPAVEKTSEIIGNTVMRPSVTLGATTTALVVGFFFYFTAKHYGFRLSGSELLLSLLVGGVIGIVIEAIVKLAQRLARN